MNMSLPCSDRDHASDFSDIDHHQDGVQVQGNHPRNDMKPLTLTLREGLY